MVSAEGRRSSARKASASSSKGAPSVTSTAAASSTKENSVPSSSGSKPSLAKKGTNEGLNSNKRNWFDNASDRGSVVSTPKKGPSEDLEDLTV